MPPFASTYQKRLAIVQAMRNFDESNRLTGSAFDEETGRMCACAVAWTAIGLDMDSFDYNKLTDELGFDHQFIYRLNDKHDFGKESGLAYTVHEIGNILGDMWGA